MKIILSPAKRMRSDPDSLPHNRLPRFLPEAERIKTQMQKMPAKALQTVWRCSDAIAAENIDRLAHMDLRKNLTPALLAYDGIQYRHMAPGVFTETQFAYIQAHLRILSGFYGMLFPFDGVAPYRLEMGAKLRVGRHSDLYAYWGGSLAAALAEEADCVLNLASAEYSKAVLPHLPGNLPKAVCIFAEIVAGKPMEKGTLCKMARGQMVRYLAEQQIEKVEDVRGFDGCGFTYCKAASSAERYVFIKGG